ncbi:MAG: response regulator transcription factor [Burkholderiales bacterium]|jgi:DNA-binding NarL/FixJ family response regulator|nr:response regulator transcription factor [Burkholderiales bacterium]
MIPQQQQRISTATEQGVRVLIVDDHAIVREGLKRILADAPELRVAGEAASGTEAIRLVREGSWDVMLLDVSLPGANGLEVLRAVRECVPQLPVLVLTMYPEDQYAIRMLRAGAAGYLTKEGAPGQLVTAIRKVAAGGKYISPAVAEKLAWELERRKQPATHEDLSNREFEILRLIASGKTVSQIGQDLHLSVKTVSTYRMRLLTKLNMKSNAELTHYAIKGGLVD